MIRIAITGPESTGKSWLCDALGKHYGAVTIAEYAREYLDTLSHPYALEDVLNIARKQNQLIQDASASDAKMIICDTEMLVISIWLEHKYGIKDPWVEAQLSSQPFDLYLLCDVDLPWEEDPLREHPHLRNHFFNLFKTKLEQLHCKVVVISGTGQTRLGMAVDAVEELKNLAQQCKY